MDVVWKEVVLNYSFVSFRSATTSIDGGRNEVAIDRVAVAIGFVCIFVTEGFIDGGRKRFVGGGEGMLKWKYRQAGFVTENKLMVISLLAAKFSKYFQVFRTRRNDFIRSYVF